MLLLLASLAALAPARADSITLDSGATIEGDLARYEFGGDCQLSVTEGPLTGVILIVPCHRVQSFMRTSVRTPVAIGLVEESVGATAALDALPVVAGDSASGGVPVQASETRALSFGQGAGAGELSAVAVDVPAVEDPRAEADEEPFYDEPLFPSDPTEPIGFAPPRSAAPASVEPTGPRMAPRMDEPSTERRVSF